MAAGGAGLGRRAGAADSRGPHDRGDRGLGEVFPGRRADFLEGQGFDLAALHEVVAVAEAVEFIERGLEGEGVVALVADLLLADDLFLARARVPRR